MLSSFQSLDINLPLVSLAALWHGPVLPCSSSSSHSLWSDSSAPFATSLSRSLSPAFSLSALVDIQVTTVIRHIDANLLVEST